jgi:Pectate lyase superfamily protein
MVGKLAITLLFLVTCVSGAYVVNRNVKDYGATGNGVTDDTQAIINALTQGRGDNRNDNYPNAKYSSSTQTPAYVFFPSGTYLVTQTLPVIYYTQMVFSSPFHPFYLFLTPYTTHHTHDHYATLPHKPLLFFFFSLSLLSPMPLHLPPSILKKICRWETPATPQQSNSCQTKACGCLKLLVVGTLA